MSSIETGPDNVVTIKVVGVGGAGCNAINRMVKSGMKNAEFIAVNTDKPALINSNADVRIQIGEKLTKGQGAGADPEVGRKAAEESRNELMKALEGADMVFISGGMGGGTGTGAAPVIADIAKEMGALTVGVVTKPFGFEGSRRMKQAEDGISNLLDKVDSLLVIPNDRLRFVTEEKITLQNAFEIADSVLHDVVSSISELVMSIAAVNLDFADVTSVMSNAGFTHIGIGRATGKNKAEEAVRQAVASPLMETSVNGASGILINYTGSTDLALEDVTEATNLVREAANPNANILFGANIDETIDDEITVVIIATKFDKQPTSQPVPEKKDAKRASIHPDAKAEGAAPAFDRLHTGEEVAAAQTEVRTEKKTSVDDDDDPYGLILDLFKSR